MELVSNGIKHSDTFGITVTEKICIPFICFCISYVFIVSLQSKSPVLILYHQHTATTECCKHSLKHVCTPQHQSSAGRISAPGCKHLYTDYILGVTPLTVDEFCVNRHKDCTAIMKTKHIYLEVCPTGFSVAYSQEGVSKIKA